MDLGRSRIIDVKTEVDASFSTTERTKGKRSEMKEIDPHGLRVDTIEEVKQLNFYSVTWTNFQNVTSNHTRISSKINARLISWLCYKCCEKRSGISRWSSNNPLPEYYSSNYRKLIQN